MTQSFNALTHQEYDDKADDAGEFFLVTQSLYRPDSPGVDKANDAGEFYLVTQSL